MAIVNAAFARKHFGTDSALGRRFRTATADGNAAQAGPWRTVVGVVTTVRMLGPFNNPNVDDSGFYVPFYSAVPGPLPTPPAPFVSQFATVVVKPRGGQQAEALTNALRREVSKVDPNLPLYFVGTPKKNINSFVSQNRIVATMFSILGLVAVVLASVGIYGVMSFAVSQRTQEFGVRMALGAPGGRILGMVLRQGALQVGLGLMLGLGLTLAIVAFGGAGIQNQLFGVSARDAFTYSAVATLIVIVSLTATLIPARRATQVDPMIALRAE